MEFTGIKGKIFSFSQTVMLLAYLNFLWILFTLIGGIILGIHPSTVALYAMLREWREQDADSVTFRKYKMYFRKHFKKSNLLGIVINLLILISIYNGVLLYINQPNIHFIVNVIYIVSVILLMVFLIYVYPVYVLFDKKISETMTYSLIIGMGNPLTTLIILVLVSILGIVVYSTAGLPMFFGISLMSFIICKYTMKIYQKMKEKSPDTSNPLTVNS